MNIIVPMAGAGSRFEKAGYTFPKPLIEVKGQPMIAKVVENLDLQGFVYVSKFIVFTKLTYIIMILISNWFTVSFYSAWANSHQVFQFT